MLAGAVLLIAALSLVLWNWHESNPVSYTHLTLPTT